MTTDPVAPGEYAETRTIALPEGEQLPESFAALEPEARWWQLRPRGARLVGLVVAREDMPAIARQREAIAGFGVPIEGFRHPAPETGETWGERLHRLFGRLSPGDVLVVADKHALGRSLEEESRTLAELSRRGIIVKVLGHTAL